MTQLSHVIQNRQWKPFNALRKPERTIINMQPLDMAPRSHFAHLGENMWYGGDQVRAGPPRREEKMEPGRQPITVNIEQQDETTWWILIDVGNNERPPSWMRCWSAMLQRTLEDFILDPLARVHRPFPEHMHF